MDLICLSNGEAAPLLGPGFKFHPTEEELISYYLTQKVANRNSVFQAIGEVDFNKCEPGDLPSMAKVRDQGNFYFFSLKGRKYSRGMRKNRATGAGCWKSTGPDREVKTGVKKGEAGRLLGMKKTLVFYTGRAPKLVKTSWIMHEHRLPDESKSDQQQWVVCKVFKQKVSNKMAPEKSNCDGRTTADVDPSDTIAHLVAGWDMGPPEPMWDFNEGPSSEISSDFWG